MGRINNHSRQGIVYLIVSQERWDKAVDIVSWITEEIESSHTIEMKKMGEL
jgi:hypothetical protein